MTDSEQVITILNDIKQNQEHQFERTESRQDKLEDALAQLATGINTLALAVAKMEESHASMQKEQDIQRETDELQNHKIEVLKDEMNELDKRLIPLKDLPEEVKKNRCKGSENTQRLDSQSERIKGLENKLTSFTEKLEKIAESQQKDDQNWSVVGSVGKWFVNKALIPILVAVAGAAAAITSYLKLGGQ